MNRKIPHDELAVGILLHLNLGQVEERSRCMFFIQQVIAICVVDFKIAYINLDFVSVVLPDVLKDVRQSSRDNSTIGIPLCTSSNRKRLS